jgi:hypothetical protein
MSLQNILHYKHSLSEELFGKVCSVLFAADSVSVLLPKLGVPAIEKLKPVCGLLLSDCPPNVDVEEPPIVCEKFFVILNTEIIYIICFLF